MAISLRFAAYNFRMGFFFIMEPARSLRETPHSFTRPRLKHLFRFAAGAI